MQHILELYLGGTAITKLLTSIVHLTDLVLLNVRDCKSLMCLPSIIFNLKLLKDVNISRCSKLKRLPENVGNIESVEELNVSGTTIREVPSSIDLLKNLKVLSFSGCKGYRHLTLHLGMISSLFLQGQKLQIPWVCPLY